MAVIIVSGPKGTGKTSYVREYAAASAARGRSVGGIASPAIVEGEERVGYDSIDLRSGKRRALARAVSESDPAPNVGPYRFDDQAITKGNAAIMAAVQDRLDVIAIDEVGPLEFRGKGWAPALELALREDDSPRELLVVVRPALVDDLAGRFPSAAWLSARRIVPPWP